MKPLKRRVLTTLLFLILASCSKSLPTDELAVAKVLITRAQDAHAEEFAPSELSQAKSYLKTAHEAAMREDIDSLIQSTRSSTIQSLEAIEKSLPKYSSQSREIASRELESSEELYASKFSPKEFQQANSFRKQGDEELANAESQYGIYLSLQDLNRKKEVREAIFQTYERSIAAYQNSLRNSKESKNISLSRKPEISTFAQTIQAEIQEIDRLNNGKDPRVDELRTQVLLASQELEENKLKQSYIRLESANKTSKFLLAEAILNHAKMRNKSASEKFASANDSFLELNSSLLKEEPETMQSYENTEEVLGAARESLESSTSLFSQEKYSDSIRQSNESIRLSEIVIEQVDTLKSQESAITARKLEDALVDEMIVEQPLQEIKEELPPKEEDYFYYTVKSLKPSECLWRIAHRKEVYGDAKEWKRIFEANRDKISSPNKIYPNQVLKIPKITAARNEE
jgi:hypothetical protein